MSTIVTTDNVVSQNGRAWPLPNRKPAMRMKWHNLLFMHWPVPASSITPHLPSGLEVDEYDATAWISVVPFTMSGVAPRWLPDIPWMSKFPELNVRTYVTCNGKPGVWFFTLDATNPLAVRFARSFYCLNYVDARIHVNKKDNWTHYHSVRTDRAAENGELSVEYRPVGAARLAQERSLSYWLTARYCLYSASNSGKIFRGEIDHDPWLIRDAQAIVRRNTMLDFLGVNVPVLQPPFLQYAERTDVVAWKLDPVQ